MQENKMRGLILPMLLGITIGCMAGYGHYKSFQPYELEVVYPVVISAEDREPMLIEEETFEYDEDIPKDVQDAAEKYGKVYDLSPEMLEAIAFYESSYRTNVDSPNGKYKGLMQIGGCHQDRMKKLGVTDLYNADQNMHVAADYLAELFEESDNVVIALMRYNGDSSWKSGNISNYAKKVINKTIELEIKHGKYL